MWWMRGVVLLGWGLFFVAIVVEIATFRFPSKMLYFGCFVLAGHASACLPPVRHREAEARIQILAGRDDCSGDPGRGNVVHTPLGHPLSSRFEKPPDGKGSLTSSSGSLPRKLVCLPSRCRSVTPSPDPDRPAALSV